MDHTLKCPFRFYVLGAGFQTPMATGIKVAAFWDVASYSLIKNVTRFGKIYSLRHQGDDWRQ